ncbi:MAG: Gfo/Idh/MocA family oxidoreductase [Phycisphaeraceae bacterium]|nr:Gfo/Idh/MocA family oxidoreductase [Phycisphaeraceae bacterium]MCW5762533.1 Gfo/Idh/MocA family oxidoreductase [Phycisphaeraceae bacterium]
MFESDRRTFLGQTAGLAAFALMPKSLYAFGFSGAAVRVAIIGAGRQGRAIIGELAKIDGVEIAALCDVDSTRLDAGLRRTRGAIGYAAHEALLDKADTFDAVFIATPTHLHRKPVEDCIAAGKHVYCDGPLASTIEDAAAIARAARSAGTVFQSGMQGRSNPVYTLARSFFRSDSVRDLVSIHAQQNRKASWRVPADSPDRDRALNWRLDPDVTLGLAGELGTQQIDTVCWFTGKYPVSVRGLGSVRLHRDGREVADTISCQLAFEDGAVMTYDATLANSYGGTFETLFGTNAAIKLAGTHAWMFKEADAPTQGWEVYANRQQFHNDEGITLIAGATQLASQGKLQEGIGLPHAPLYYAVGDFLKSVASGANVACSAEEGYRATVVGIKAAQAVATGQTVSIAESDLRVS